MVPRFTTPVGRLASASRKFSSHVHDDRQVETILTLPSNHAIKVSAGDGDEGHPYAKRNQFKMQRYKYGAASAPDTQLGWKERLTVQVLAPPTTLSNNICICSLRRKPVRIRRLHRNHGQSR